MNDEELKDLIAPAITESEPAPAMPAPEPPAEGPARAPDGKFAAKASDAAPEPATPQPPLTEKETVGFYKAMQEERDKRQAAERRIAELTANQPPPAPLDTATELQQALYGQKLGVSRKFAEREYGKDTIATVHDWASARCDADPAFNDHMRSSDDPYEAAMAAYNREQILAEVKSPDDLAQFNAWKAAQAAGQAETPPPPPPPSPPAPKSLVNAPGNGAVGKAHVPLSDDAAYAALFTR